ncbi:Helix-turn-helix domain protein [Caulifigura coniformis]|uniref:Helix-turn-helix domain protein n=1 Tax=Caulifigura coniformis TaxID=2527983 RepID=A0A517SCL2_9PLAN|nr:helix-turn-helix domain-containing protein [Caulifigura coniformis]QDT53854.1 Helix-turn-helix domain protein [Caulifigura coniformis]
MKELQNISELMSVATVAKRLKHSPATVYALIESGRLAHYRCPGIRVSEEQLQAFLESVKQPAQKTEQSPPPARIKLRHISL